MTSHAFSGDRRVPLTPDKLHPFGQTPGARPVRRPVQKQDRTALVKRLRRQVADLMGVDYDDTAGTSHGPHKVRARAEVMWLLETQTDMSRTDIAKALGAKSCQSVKRLLDRRAEGWR